MLLIKIIGDNYNKYNFIIIIIARMCENTVKCFAYKIVQILHFNCMEKWKKVMTYDNIMITRIYTLFVPKKIFMDFTLIYS